MARHFVLMFCLALLASQIICQEFSDEVHPGSKQLEVDVEKFSSEGLPSFEPEISTEVPHTDDIQPLVQTQIENNTKDSEDQDRIKKIEEASSRVVEVIKKELEELKPILKNSLNRNKRETTDNLAKFLYYLEPKEDTEGLINGKNNDGYLIDILPDVETNETELNRDLEVKTEASLPEEVEPPKIVEEFTTTNNPNSIETQDSMYRQESSPTHYPFLTNQLHNTSPMMVMTGQDEPMTYVQEMSDKVETDVVEQPGEPKISHISRSSVYRLAQTVPHYGQNLPDQMRYYFF